MHTPSATPKSGDRDYLSLQRAFLVWNKVYTKPSEQTFVEITDQPEARATSAYVWVFLAGALSLVINGVIQAIVDLSVLRQFASESREMAALLSTMYLVPIVFFMIGSLVCGLCPVPFAGAMAMIGFVMNVGMTHSTARFFGG